MLEAICDLAPPVSHMSGREWLRALEQATDRVLEACVSLDPPGPTGPVRASDGRSIWIAPTEPHLTHEHVLAQEERILAFALEAHDPPAAPSVTLDHEGLDVLQADAAAAVAGRDQLVLVIGPAGTGKTTALRHAVEDLHGQARSVFGVAPTAKAAKVLRDETLMPADTVAKLLYEWRTGAPHDHYRLPWGTTVVVDEAGMIGTGALDDLVALAVSQRWRLVLVGDPHQLQAVGRGGMFDELCRTGRTHELATIHRFRQSWERDASLLLRAANPDALETYIAHARVTPGTFDDLVTDAARTLIQHSSEGRTVAMTAETNDHVAALNAAIQQQRRQRGDLGQHAARVAAGETASVGNVVATRRNDRTLHTDQGEPVRNRDRWTVIGAHPDGSLTVSHLHGHGTAILPAEYVRNHVRLGYAATAYGHQGDTVDVSLTLITEATSHRSLYVGATRGRHDNQILVVADPDQARDVLEHVLTNDRADVPALVQRRNLARQLPRPHDPERAVTTARHALEHAIRRAEPFTRPLHQAEAEVERTTAAVRQMRAAIAQTPRWRRIGLTAQLHEAEHCLADKFAGLDAAQRAAEPYIALVDRAETELHKAELVERQTRINDRMDRLSMDPPSRTLERDGPGRSFGIDL